MDKLIERIVQNNPTLDDAEVITMSITREDRTKRHYYIYKKNEDLEHLYARIPLSVLTKENGKGRYKHYIVVAVKPTGFEVYDLNKPRNIQVENNTVLVGNVDSIGFNFNENENNEPLPF